MPVIISATELDRLRREGRDIAVIDVRWTLGGPSGRAEYGAGHIPGAVYVDLDTELAAAPGAGGRHPLPDPDVPLQALRRAGVGQETCVVVYDADVSLSAARAWWVFRHVGIEDVRVLDGGFAAWCAAGLPVSTAPAVVEQEGTVVPRDSGMPTVSAAEILSDGAQMTVIDVRAPERYRGEMEPIDPVAGHIPGAINRPTTDNVTADGVFLSVEELRERFADLPTDRPVAVYCGSGVTAAHTVLALHRIGIPAALYPGSWSGWITDPSRPVATGETP